MENNALNQIEDDELEQVSGGTGALGGLVDDLVLGINGLSAVVVEVVTNLPRFLGTWFGGSN